MFSYVWWNASQNHRSSRAERASTIRAARVCFVCCASRSSLALASSGMRTSALMTKVYNMVNRDVYTVDGRGSVHSLGEQHDRDVLFTQGVNGLVSYTHLTLPTIL